MCQDVRGSERNDAEAGGGAHQSVGDFGDSAIASGRDDHLLAAPDRLARQSFGMADPTRRHAADRVEHMGTAATGHGIEDNHHSVWGP